MRATFGAAPDRDALARTPLHVLVRDFPELLPLFRSEGLDLTESGAEPLGSVTASPADLLDRIEAALGWRERGRG